MAPKVRKFKHAVAPPSTAPTLPASVQTSLLQVGMRVRKAVSQGYLTNIKLGSDSAASQSWNSGLLNSTSTKQILRDSTDDRPESPSERVLLEEEGDSFDSLPSSQSSVSTVATTSSVASSLSTSAYVPPDRSRKRELDVDADDYNQLFFDGEDDIMDAITTHLRPMAQPKSRKRAGGSAGEAGLATNSKWVTRLDGDGRESDDFEEADFLRPTDGGW